MGRSINTDGTLDNMPHDAMNHGVRSTRGGLLVSLSPCVEYAVKEEVALQNLGLEIAGSAEDKDENVLFEKPDDE